jgi:hypothetical protein
MSDRKPLVWCERLLLAALAVVYLPGVVLTIRDLVPLPKQVDFAAYYVAARAMHMGLSPYDPRVADSIATSAGITERTPYIYPPLLARAIEPLAAFQYDAAARVWLALSIAALVLALYLLAQHIHLRRRLLLVAIPLVMFTPAVHYTLELGQINHFLLLMMTTAVLTSSPILSGALIGVAGALKVYPLALGAVFLLEWNVIALGGTVISAALLTALGSLGTSADSSVVYWLAQVAPAINVERLITPGNQSLQAICTRLFAAHTFEAVALSASLPTTISVEPILNAPALASAAAAVLSIVIAGVSGWTLIRTRRAPGPVARLARFSLVLTLMLIVLPVVWDHYYVLLLLPAAVLYQRRHIDVVRLALPASLLLVHVHRYWRLTLYAHSPLLLSFGLAGVCVMWAALVVVMNREST